LEEEKKKYDVKNANMTLVSKKIGEKLLTGWTMLSTSCPQSGCQGTPLMNSPEGDVQMFCVACEQIYEYDRYGTLNTKNKSYDSAAKPAVVAPPPTPLRGSYTASLPIDATENYDTNYFLNMNNAPVLSPYRDNNYYSSTLERYDALGESTYAVSSALKQSNHSGSNTHIDTEDSSSKLSKKLLLGWAMLDRVCTADGCTGNVPLMRDLTGKVRCVECDFDATIDKSSPVKVRTVQPTVATPFSSPTPIIDSPLSSDIISKVSRKVSLGWTVQDNYCMAPECTGNVPLMLDLDGNVRCVQCLNHQTKHALSPVLADIYAEKLSRAGHVSSYENPLSAQQMSSETRAYDSYNYSSSRSPVTPSKVTFSPIVNTETYSIESSTHSSSHSSYFDVDDSSAIKAAQEEFSPHVERTPVIGTPFIDKTTPQFYTAQSPQKSQADDSIQEDPTTPTVGERTPSEFHTVYTLDRSMFTSKPVLPPSPPRPIYDELDISKKMYDKMFAGWIMINKNCKNTACKGTSLMQSTSKQAELVCVCCDAIYKLDDNNNIITVYDPYNQTATTTTITENNHLDDPTSNTTLVNSFPASSLEYIPYIPETKGLSSYQDILDKYASTATTSTNVTTTSTVMTSTYTGSYQDILDKYSPVARNTADNSTTDISIINSSSKQLSTPSKSSNSRSHHETLEVHLTSSATPGSPSTGYQDILDKYLPRSNYGDTREALSVLKAAKGSNGILSALKLKLKNVCNELEDCLNVDEALKLTDLMIKLEQAISMLDSSDK